MGRLTVAVLLNLLVVVIELVAAHIAGSLSLASDALHNLQDVLAFLISLVALYLSRRTPTPTSTYGYARAEAFGAFIGSSALILSVLYVGYEAVRSLLLPHREVAGGYVLVVGTFAFIVNSVSAYLLHGRGDLNVRSAYLHLLGDAAFSLAVVVGGVLMFLTGWNLFDAVLTLLFVPFLLRDGLSVLGRSVRILMEFAPEGYDSQKVTRAIVEVEGVKEVHDVHIWAISSRYPSVSAHVVVDGKAGTEEVSRILSKIEEKLKGMGIHHITLQIEPEGYRCESTCV